MQFDWNENCSCCHVELLTLLCFRIEPVTMLHNFVINIYVKFGLFVYILCLVYFISIVCKLQIWYPIVKCICVFVICLHLTLFSYLRQLNVRCACEFRPFVRTKLEKTLQDTVTVEIPQPLFDLVHFWCCVARNLGFKCSVLCN